MKISPEQLAQSLFRASAESIEQRKGILTSPKEQAKRDLIRRYLKAGKSEEFILKTVFGLEAPVDKPVSYFISANPGVTASPHEVYLSKRDFALKLIRELCNEGRE